MENVTVDVVFNSAWDWVCAVEHCEHAQDSNEWRKRRARADAYRNKFRALLGLSPMPVIGELGQGLTLEDQQG